MRKAAFGSLCTTRDIDFLHCICAHVRDVDFLHGIFCGCAPTACFDAREHDEKCGGREAQFSEAGVKDKLLDQCRCSCDSVLILMHRLLGMP